MYRKSFATPIIKIWLHFQKDSECGIKRFTGRFYEFDEKVDIPILFILLLWKSIFLVESTENLWPYLQH